MTAPLRRLPSNSTDTAPAALVRGIQRSKVKIDGHYVYRLVFSTGRVGSWYRPRVDVGEDEADVVAMLAKRQRAEDPVRHLRLVTPTSPRRSLGAHAARTSLLRARHRSAPTSPPRARSVPA